MTHPPAHGHVPSRAADRLREDCTEIELIWIEKRLEHWIRFGRIASERIVSRKTRIVSFRPDAIVAFVRWSANDFGTVHSRIDILRAVRSEAHTSELPSLMRIPSAVFCLKNKLTIQRT